VGWSRPAAAWASYAKAGTQLRRNQRLRARHLEGHLAAELRIISQEDDAEAAAAQLAAMWKRPTWVSGQPAGGSVEGGSGAGGADVAVSGKSWRTSRHQATSRSSRERSSSGTAGS